jgi:uncharacterized protein YjiS (DUF1127 family)
MSTLSDLVRIVPGHALGSLFVRRIERSNALASLANRLLHWQDRATQRHALAHMDDRGLADLGLSRIDVAAETRKSFWQA